MFNNLFFDIWRVAGVRIRLWAIFSVSLLINFASLFLKNLTTKSLHSQIIVVLEGIICFSVRFCDNSLVVLKMRFQVFSFASKNVQGFSSERKILMSLLSVLFHLQKLLSVFWNLDFQPRSAESLKSTSFPQEIWENPFNYRATRIKMNIRHDFVGE